MVRDRNKIIKGGSRSQSTKNLQFILMSEETCLGNNWVSKYSYFIFGYILIHKTIELGMGWALVPSWKTWGMPFFLSLSRECERALSLLFFLTVLS